MILLNNAIIILPNKMFSKHLPYVSTDDNKITISEEFLKHNIDNFNYNPLIVSLRYKNILYITGIHDFTPDKLIVLPENIASIFSGTSIINVKLTNPAQIQKVAKIKIRPMNPSFYDIKNHKILLEQILSKYIVINTGLLITITEGDITTAVVIEEIQDKYCNLIGHGITLNQDVEVDFLEIPGYQEYLDRKQKEKEIEELERKRKNEEKLEKDTYSLIKTNTHTKKTIHDSKIMYVRPDN